MINNSDELEPTVLLYVLGLVDHTRWAAKAGIVGVVGAQAGGDWLSSNDVALLCGMSAARARKYLRELEEDRVMFRAAGGGCQPFWCRVNPDVLAWRRVPWKLDASDLAIRLAFHEDHARAETTAGERFNARPRGARRRDFFARARAARQQIEERRSTRAPGARGERIVEMLQRAPQGRATSDASTRAPGARVDERGFPRSSSPLGDGAESPPPHGVNGADGPGRGEVDAAVLEQARRLVMSRALPAGDGRRFLNGKPLEHLRQVVADHGPEILDVIRATTAGTYRVPAFIAEIEMVAAAGDLGDVDEDLSPGHDPERILGLHERIDNLVRQIATFEDLGDEDHVGDLRNELATCENELQTISAGGAQS